MDDLPTASDIAPTPGGFMDELDALDDWLGLTFLEVAERLPHFSFNYVEHLRWVGPVAYKYYLKAFVCYLQSDASIGDSSVAGGILNIFHFLNDGPNVRVPPDVEKECISMIFRDWTKYFTPDEWKDFGEWYPEVIESLGSSL